VSFLLPLWLLPEYIKKIDIKMQFEIFAKSAFKRVIMHNISNSKGYTEFCFLLFNITASFIMTDINDFRV